ncbi:MAG TPA: hypothetical protein VJN48_00620, partial [Terriglobales bacterium]|nr:hypothetical protein [Terriglobales bacterium]
MIRSEAPVWATVAFVAIVLTAGFAQQAPSATNGAPKPPQQHSFNPDELVRRAVANQIKSGDDDVSLMFRVRRQTSKGVQTREYVETAEGTAGMLVAVNDQPISPEQRQQEFARLEQLRLNPGELRKKQKQQKEDSDRVNRMVQALPDAFRYQYEGTEQVNGLELVRLRFQPNPDFDPPSREQQVFTGMDGFLLIEPHQARIARIDGTLFKDVGFGWGILGHLDRGGRFVVAQGPVANGYWTTTHMQLSFTGKALFFKNINIQETEDSSDFRRVPGHMTFAQGVEMLKKQRNGVVA